MTLTFSLKRLFQPILFAAAHLNLTMGDILLLEAVNPTNYKSRAEAIGRIKCLLMSQTVILTTPHWESIAKSKKYKYHARREKNLLFLRHLGILR
ncbi:hypothetical protein [Marinomonas balearica]|uniref:hypothetical protein n=1 Tax=Marinomonas balearica TaxID=491947 RepID=UPI001060B86C|nr:hypothetical protein [Marinomonas balearica]